MMTIPLLPWVAKLGANRAKLASFSIAKYGAQTGSDWQWFPDAGNGVLTNGQNVTGNDPNDANVLSDSIFQRGWVQQMVSKWGTASNGGVKYYILDNEHSIWHSTHRDVQPTGARMDEIRDKVIDYSSKIKSIDPSALVVGPEEWGWSGYIFSGYDQQYGGKYGWSSLPDRTAHGGQDYLPYLLSQWKQSATSTGVKPIDVFSVHFYPQGGEYGNDTSTTMQLRRNQSTRSLWDPNYVDPTWINDRVQLIPRLRNWANTYYFAGTPIGITEYNWGAESHINGATTQADIYGIFGREGLDMATRWTTPDAATPTYKAMKMYRNYDGNKGTFGETSVQAAVANPDNLSAFAAVRGSDGALTVMVINKVLSGSTPVVVNLANFAGNGSAQAWQLTSANAIQQLAPLSYTGSALNATVPPQSVTLFVLPVGTTPANQAPKAVISATPVTGTAPLAVNFSGTGSTDADGTIASYSWAFGDGTTGTGATVSHTYSAAGTYTATLTVKDNANASGTASTTINVSAVPTAPNAPSNLTAATSNGSVTLTWKDNSTDESGFYVERAPAGTASYVRAGQVGVNATTFTEARPRGTYLYRVQAFSTVSGKVSAYSNSVQIRVR